MSDDVYVAPDPTPEQKELARYGADPYDRAGKLPIWDLAANDTIAAAATIHDEMYMEGGTPELGHQVDANFARDCSFLARAVDGYVYREFEELKAAAAAQIVDLYGPGLWQLHSRNTDITRAQGRAFMSGAKSHVNWAAKKIEETPPYPEVESDSIF